MISTAMFLLEMAVAARYGLHRDELYFIECGRHLAWGYVDQPPIVPAIARLMSSLFGPSPLALRFLPAVAGAGTVVLTALTARELGGGRTAQVLGALAAASSCEALATFHLLSPTAFDAFFWCVVVYLVVRLSRTADDRLWLAIGAACGMGLMAKLNMGFLMLAVVIGLVMAGRGRMLANRWALGGGVLALAIFSPDLAWNATHGWAQVAMLSSLRQENSTLEASLVFIPAQLLFLGVVVVVFALLGLVRLGRHELGRPLAFAFLILLAWYTLSGGKPYYIEGIYYALFAAGGLAVEERCARREEPGIARRWAVATVIVAVVSLPLVLPVVPIGNLPRSAWEGKINEDLSATLGWPQFVRQIAGIADRLPRAERAHLVIYTGDYGAAGAIDVYGRSLGLPPAISGHNTYWWWGPGDAPNDSTTIAVNLPGPYLLTIFREVQPAGTVATPHDAWTEERGDPIFICTAQTQTWAAAWPAARHYG